MRECGRTSCQRVFYEYILVASHIFSNQFDRKIQIFILFCSCHVSANRWWRGVGDNGGGRNPQCLSLALANTLMNQLVSIFDFCIAFNDSFDLLCFLLPVSLMVLFNLSWTLSISLFSLRNSYLLFLFSVYCVPVFLKRLNSEFK